MDVSVVDVSEYLSGGESAGELCGEVSRSLRETGALLVKDPRCSAADNDRFLDMMERYFQSPSDFKLRHERPHLHYQVRLSWRRVRFYFEFAFGILIASFRGEC